MKDRTFCDANHQLRGLIADIICEVEMCIKYEDISGLYQATEDLKLASEIVEETQEYAEKMENRMKKYKSAIESLGFVRL